MKATSISPFTDADRAWLDAQMSDPRLDQVSGAARDLHRRTLWYLRTTRSRDSRITKAQLAVIAKIDAAVIERSIAGMS